MTLNPITHIQIFNSRYTMMLLSSMRTLVQKMPFNTSGKSLGGKVEHIMMMWTSGWMNYFQVFIYLCMCMCVCTYVHMYTYKYIINECMHVLCVNLVNKT